MATRPWVISVLSTDYDLHEHRTAIITKLKTNNVVVSAFELPDFPVESDIHSHDNCIRALDRIDIALLIIDSRYGGIYINDSTHSITEEEYFAVANSQKPCLVFISKQTWDEWHSYKTQFNAWIKDHTYTALEIEEGLPKRDFDNRYVKIHVESTKIFDFVKSIQNSYQRFSISNWIDQYQNIPDLLTRINGKLEGLTRHFLEELVIKQKKKLESRHTSTGLGLSLGDVFSRGYYLEPSFSIESGELLNGIALNDKVTNTLLDDSSILVYGEAGYGKTTLLAKSYLSHVKYFTEKDSYQVPFYLWLKEKSSEYHFDFFSYIKESFEDDWKRDIYPYINLKTIRPYFYFDGFDEIAEKMAAEEVEKISKADIFSYTVLLTCRQQYAFRYINNFEFSNKFGIRVKVNTWDINMAHGYIDNFCQINSKDINFVNAIKQLLSENQDLRDILNSPLLLTMLLWIVEQKRMRIPETIRSRIQLFSICINELSKRELTRLGKSESFAPELVILWSYAAWEVYYNKLNDNISKVSLLIKKLKSLFSSFSFDYTTSYFEALFDCSGDEIFGTFHEQFLEYLVANTIFVACRDAKYPFPEFLSYVMRPEINRYFRAIWNEATPEVQVKIVTNLHNQYLQNLGNDSFEAVSKRVHAIYHIGRFGTPQRQEIVEKAFNSETHLSVRLSLFFGEIKMGNLIKEQDFFELLTSDQDCNEANRGYHLAYYADSVYGNALPYVDDISKKWTGTLKAFLRHFSSTDVSHYFLRRIDLITMKNLIEARTNVEPLTNDILNDFERLINDSPFSKEFSEFHSKIIIAFDELKRSFIDLSN